MSRIMVRYKVKPDLAETNAGLVRACTRTPQNPAEPLGGGLIIGHAVAL